MTPNARYAAAIGILDAILAGVPAEKTLTNWARSNRYAGSKDRAAVRDIVFDCLRQKRSLMHKSGFDGARGLVAGHILATGHAVTDVFTGERFAADVLSTSEQTALEQMKETPTDVVRLDVPDWIAPKLHDSLGEGYEVCLAGLQTRAPLDLRVNPKKATLDMVQTALVKDGIETENIELVPGALRVTANPRRVAMSQAYKSGWVEIQDAGSQAVVEALPMEGVKTVLDYCAGGGGKSLAIAARSDVKVNAYDINLQRMKDLGARAKRAGVAVPIVEQDPVLRDQKYDLVLLDVPCSGTGAWRRNPDGKWRFTETELNSFRAVQFDIMTSVAKLVQAGGAMAYVTCSLLCEENEDQIARFVQAFPGWIISEMIRFDPSQGTDGFFVAVLKKQL